MTRESFFNKRENDQALPNKRENSSPRRAMGGKTLGALLPRVTHVAFKKKSPLFVKIIMDWENLVGAHIAQQTAPRRLNSGVLTVACSGPIVMEMRYHSLQILERMNTALGLYGAFRLQSLKLIQDLTLEPKIPQKPKEPIQPIAIDAIENNDLKDVLGRLGGYIKARQKLEEAKGGEDS